MTYKGLRFLRPYLFKRGVYIGGGGGCTGIAGRCGVKGSEEFLIARRQRSRSFVGPSQQQQQQCRRHFSSSAVVLAEDARGEGTGAVVSSSSPESSAESYYEKRMEKLREYGAYEDLYPRLGAPNGRLMSLEAFRIRYANLKKEQTDTLFTITLRGRVYAVRHGGARLLFFTLAERHQSMQIICSLSSMATAGVTEDEFKRFSQVVRKGDWFSISGYPEKTKSGAVSLRAVQLPQILSPSLHEHPLNLSDKEIKARKRHVHLIANPEAGDLLRLRTEIEYSLQTYFREEGFTKVSTPILAARAGGAAARPFETVATEFVNRPLQLRVAPELFLKRLIVGGIKGVYEIGPVFRNEGVDLLHNPEFTICEFYKPLANLKELMEITQAIFKRIQKVFETRRKDDFPRLPELDVDFKNAIQKLDFIETIEKALGQRMPDLNSPASVEELVRIMKQNDIPLPSTAATASTLSIASSSLDPASKAKDPETEISSQDACTASASAITLPRLLDTLSKHLIEPQCGDPTFIMHHPAIMSPLAKSFVDPRSGQTVSARAELFVRGREYVNCYEEENSPFEQRRKFEQQVLLRKGGDYDVSSETKAPILESDADDANNITNTTSDTSDSQSITEQEAPASASASAPVSWSFSSSSSTNINPSSINTSISTKTKKKILLDEENYLEALEWALPPTGGWGVGVDRLVMLFSGQNRIANVLPFGTLRNVVGLHAGERSRGGGAKAAGSTGPARASQG